MGQHAAQTPSSRHPQRYVQCHWSISLANSTMLLPRMSYIDTYVGDIQFISLTCTLHATKYLSTSLCLPSWGKLPPLSPLGDKNQNLMKTFGFNMTHDSSGVVSGLITAKHIRFDFFFPLGPLLLVVTHSALGHAISSC